MKKAPWQREHVWIGPEGVAKKVLRWAVGDHHMPTVDGFEALLETPAWKGSTWVYDGPDHVVVTHPHGTTARVRLEVRAPLLCTRCPNWRAVLRCQKCHRRCCAHKWRGHAKVTRIKDGAAAPVCVECEAPKATFLRKAAP